MSKEKKEKKADELWNSIQSSLENFIRRGRGEVNEIESGNANVLKILSYLGYLENRQKRANPHISHREFHTVDKLTTDLIETLESLKKEFDTSEKNFSELEKKRLSVREDCQELKEIAKSLKWSYQRSDREHR